MNEDNKKNIFIPEDIHQELKKISSEKGVYLYILIQDVIRMGIEQYKKEL